MFIYSVVHGWTSLAVQGLKLCTSTPGGMGSIPGQGTRILHAVCVPAQSLSRVQLFATLWTVAREAPLSMEFPENTGVGCHFLLQGIFLIQELNLGLQRLLHWQAGSLWLMALGSPCAVVGPTKQNKNPQLKGPSLFPGNLWRYEVQTQLSRHLGDHSAAGKTKPRSNHRAW